MYVIRSDDDVDEQIAQLPRDGAVRFAELGSGDGFVVYMVLEQDRLVDLLHIVWFD